MFNFLGYVVRYIHIRIIIKRGIQIGDCHILVAECLAIQKAIMITINKINSENYN